MVFRLEKNRNYTTMSNYHLRDKRISLKAKGLLSWMLSNDDNWDYSIQGIIANCKESETSITTTLNELKDYGYLHITKLTPDKTESGRFEYIYNIYEKPKQDPEKQGVENQGLEFQGVENPVQISTKTINTKIKKSLIDKSIKEGGMEKPKINFTEMYNNICTNLPKCVKVSDKRLKAINKLINKYSADEIHVVLEKANNSDFLTGKNDRGWKADIDFILREDKFINILEDKYGGKQRISTKAGSDIGQHLNRVGDKKKFREDIANGKAEKF